jgi:hypothetical protein
LDVLDTNFDFPDMRKVAIASAHAFMLVFAVDNVQSFKEVRVFEIQQFGRLPQC